MYIVFVGTFTGGKTFHGPFEEIGQADKWGRECAAGQHWEVIPLIQPQWPHPKAEKPKWYVLYGIQSRCIFCSQSLAEVQNFQSNMVARTWISEEKREYNRGEIIS